MATLYFEIASPYGCNDNVHARRLLQVGISDNLHATGGSEFSWVSLSLPGTPLVGAIISAQVSTSDDCIILKCRRSWAFNDAQETVQCGTVISVTNSLSPVLNGDHYVNKVVDSGSDIVYIYIPRSAKIVKETSVVGEGQLLLGHDAKISVSLAQFINISMFMFLPGFAFNNLFLESGDREWWLWNFRYMEWVSGSNFVRK